MMITIDLPEHIEEQLRTRAHAVGLEVEAYTLQLVLDRLRQEEQRAEGRKSRFAARTERLIALHPKTSHAVDDSRESIYEGRGD